MPGTNAVYTFKDTEGTGSERHVYDNCDAYPTGAAEKLIQASIVGNAARTIDPTLGRFPLTRAMADAITTGDDPNSLAQLVATSDWRHGQPATNYRYEVQEKNGEVQVTALTPDTSNLSDDFFLEPGKNFPEWNEQFSGTLRAFAHWARDRDH